MPVGIITWYDGNYGSALQAYALQCALETLGVQPEFVRASLPKQLQKLRIRRFRNGFFSALAFHVSNFSKRHRNKTIQSILDMRTHAISSWASSNLNLSDVQFDDTTLYTEAPQHYDCFICGSDQIWNPKITLYSDFYWLNFAPPSKTKISYAPSMGTTCLEQIDSSLIAQFLSSFEVVSTREEASTALLRQIGIPARTVADPTLLFDADWWNGAIGNPPRPKRPYLFAYILRGDTGQARLAEELARAMELDLVVYPYLEGSAGWDHGDWGDFRIDDDTPFGFISRIRDSAFVVTDSYHATLFSLQYQKPFTVLPKAGDKTMQSTRITAILDKCGALNCYAPDTSTMQIAIDWNHVQQAVRAMREEAWEYLAEALSHAPIDNAS